MTNYKEKLANLVNEIILYKPPVRIMEFDLLVRSLLIISCITTIVLSYYARHALAAKKKLHAEEMSAIRSQLDLLEEKFEKAESDILLLSKLYPEMYERTITIGNSYATWHIPSIYYSDTVIVNYNLIDIPSDTIIKNSSAEYTCLNVMSSLNPNTDIVIPAGATLVVTKAVRISRWYNSSVNPVDITASAKGALETKARR